ncbi:MAG: tyrosine-type recombinase/integrase [Acidimicrobiia bacterium]|nr:tyrosine-type recombinase/integrase [Acidimicrobiia bacterium]
MRLDTAIDAFLDDLRAAKKSPHTVDAYARDLRIVAEHLDGVETVSGVTVPVLRRAFARRAADSAPATMSRTHSAWRAFFGFLRAEGVATTNPTDEIPRASAGSEAVRSIQVDHLIERLLGAAGASTSRSAWPARDVAILALLSQAGLRLAELTGLTMGARTGTQGARQVTVIGKGRKARTIPLTDPVDALLEGYLAERRERFPDHRLDDHRTDLFVSNGGAPITRRQVQYLVERIYREAGVRAAVPSGALVHALRHTFAMDLLGHGADIVELQTLLGHASLNTTRRYLAAQPDQLRAAVATSRAASEIAAFAGDAESDDRR